MSLLIRIAQTRAGAERLLDIQLLPILAQCDFLDSRPEADQSFMGEFPDPPAEQTLTLALLQIKTLSFHPPFNATTSYSCQPFNL